MTTTPSGFAIGPPFWARLALALPDPVAQMEWSRLGHDNEIGSDFIENWEDLFLVPDFDVGRWQRSVMPARAPFDEPGWIVYDARPR